MGKAKEIRLLYNMFKEYMTPFEIIDIDEGTNKIIKKESIMMNEETLELMNNATKCKLNQLINEYDSVFVKLNEASGIDAKFLLTQLKCFTIEDIIILIKGSERMMDAYDANNNNTEGSAIVIKEWYQIEERNEFRCFIVNNSLRGISERYINVNPKYSNDEIEKITSCITDFFNDSNILSKIDTLNNEIDNNNDGMMIVIDILYLPKKNKLKIIDIEIIRFEDEIKEDKLKLFSSIQEIRDQKDEVDFRYITSDNDSRISQYEVNFNQYPLELYETDIQTLINQFKNNQ